MLEYYQLNLWNKLQWKLQQSSCIFIQENAFENFLCEMAAIFSRPQCVNNPWRTVPYTRKWPTPGHHCNVRNPILWYWCVLGPVSISDKMSHHKISWSLEAASQISKRCGNSNNQSRSLGNSRDLTIGRHHKISWSLEAASQISKRCDNSNYQCRSFETSRDLTIRRLIGYWNEVSSIIRVVFSCGLVLANFTNILQFYFASTGASAWLAHC